jgi:hypothetical protein
LDGRSAEIKADHWASGSHGFHTRPTARIVKAGVYEDITFRQPLQDLGPGETTQKTHTICHTQLLNQTFQPFSLRPIPDEPVFAGWKLAVKLCERFQSELEPFPVNKPTEADQAKTIALPRRKAVKSIDFIGR